MKVKKLKTYIFNLVPIAPLLLISLLIAFVAFGTNNSSTQSLQSCSRLTSKCQTSTIRLDNGCGSMGGWVQTSINFGCQGNGCGTPTTNPQYKPTSYCDSEHNGIVDLLFAIIRFLSAGVGLVIVASVMVGGIQYIVSRGDPNATGAAIKRITSAVTALIIFIFAYAILNFVIPGGFFQ